MEVKKKQDETGHFSNGIQCAAMARDTNTRVLLSRFRVSDVALPNSILIQNEIWVTMIFSVTRNTQSVPSRKNVYFALKS